MSQVITLGAIADIITGPFGSMLHQSDYVDIGTASIMPQNIGDRYLNYEGIARIGKEDEKRLSKYKTQYQDIIYARRGDVEKHAYIRESDECSICGTGCMRVRVYPEKANPEFVSLYLNRPESKKWITQHAVGSNMLNVNTQILSSVPIELPNTDEQNKIVKVLTSLEGKIQLNKRINDNLAA